MNIIPTILDLDKWFKKYNFKPSRDSDGGSDYVDGADSIDASKLNHQWNGKDEILTDLEKSLEILKSSITGTRLLGLLRDDYGDNMPFSSSDGDLEFTITGLSNSILSTSPNKLILPNTIFFDNIEPDNPQFAIYSGSTNLFEIQTDYPTSSKRWYRLGHNGAESPAQEVKVKKDITATNNAMVDIIFHDYMNNPTGHPQKIRLENTISGKYIEFVMENGEANYRINAETDNGGSYSNVDSGFSRTIGEHRLLVMSDNRMRLIFNFASIFELSIDHYIDGIDRISFESDNSSGSADYFDILRFDVNQTFKWTLVANNTYWLYVNVLTGQYYMTTTKSDANGNSSLLLYEINIPTGAINLSGCITNIHNLSQLMKKFLLKEGIINELTSITIDVTTVNATTVNGTTIAGTTVSGTNGNFTNLGATSLAGNITGNNKEITGLLNVNSTTVQGTNGNFTNQGAHTLQGDITGNDKNITGLNNISGVNCEFTNVKSTYFIRTLAEFNDWDTNKKASHQVIIMSGSFTISSLTLTSLSNIRFIGTKSTIISSLTLTNSANIEIDGFNVSGFNVSDNSSNITIRNCYSGYISHTFNGSFQLIENNYFNFSSGSQQMLIKRSAQTTISKTTFRNNSIGINNAINTTTGIIIDILGSDITFENNRIILYSYTASNVLYIKAKFLKFSNNYVWQRSQGGMLIDSCDNSQIINNYFYSTFDDPVMNYGLCLLNCNLTLSGNSIEGVSNSYTLNGALYINGGNNRVVGNRIYGYGLGASYTFILHSDLTLIFIDNIIEGGITSIRTYFATYYNFNIIMTGNRFTGTVEVLGTSSANIIFTNNFPHSAPNFGGSIVNLVNTNNLIY